MLTALVGKSLLKNVTLPKIMGASMVASVLFFFISNFGVWQSATLPYSKDFSGLMACYAAGLPFFTPTLIGDLFFSVLLFGGFEWASSQFRSSKRFAA